MPVPRLRQRGLYRSAALATCVKLLPASLLLLLLPPPLGELPLRLDRAVPCT